MGAGLPLHVHMNRGVIKHRWQRGEGKRPPYQYTTKFNNHALETGLRTNDHAYGAGHWLVCGKTVPHATTPIALEPGSRKFSERLLGLAGSDFPLSARVT